MGTGIKVQKIIEYFVTQSNKEDSKIIKRRDRGTFHTIPQTKFQRPLLFPHKMYTPQKYC